jgi:beta-hydroxylase
LEPGQYITPHFGYYKGFLRYHLGVVVPGGYTERCWLRINPDLDVARNRDAGAIEGGSRFHWREGEAFLFDDVLLHDAANESDEVRVILWLDVRRPLPMPLDLLNRAGLWVAARTKMAEEVRRNGVVALS